MSGEAAGPTNCRKTDMRTYRTYSPDDPVAIPWADCVAVAGGFGWCMKCAQHIGPLLAQGDDRGIEGPEAPAGDLVGHYKGTPVYANKTLGGADLPESTP